VNEIVKVAAIAYKGVIPQGQFKEPSMPQEDSALLLMLSRTIPGTPSERDEEDACDVVRSVTPGSQWRFRWRGVIGQPLPLLLALAGPMRPIRPAPGPAPIRRAETLVVLADGLPSPASGAFGAAGVY
jgi:hypothetical protein